MTNRYIYDKLSEVWRQLNPAYDQVYNQVGNRLQSRVWGTIRGDTWGLLRIQIKDQFEFIRNNDGG